MVIEQECWVRVMPRGIIMSPAVNNNHNNKHNGRCANLLQLPKL